MATITRRGKKWQAKIRRKGYPSQSNIFDSAAAAEAWARRIESEMDQGIWRDRSEAESTTLHDLLKSYLEKVVPEQRGADTATVRIQVLQRDPICQYKLSALTPKVLADWRDRRSAGGAAGSTINRELNLLSAAINWARKELMMPIDNPVANISRPKNPPPRDRRLALGEEERLMEALEDHSGADQRSDGKGYRHGTRNPYIRPLVRLALETAMRRGEMLELTWGDVDWNVPQVHLRATKNGDSRNVPLSTKAVAILREIQRSQYPDNEPAADERVFATTVAAVKKAWDRARTGAQLPDLHFHDLRHEATSRLAEKVPNLIELAAITGHRDLKSLKRYYHPRASDLAKKLG